MITMTVDVFDFYSHYIVALRATLVPTESGYSQSRFEG
jgi:hypothetical protein